jgi:hypothetical protein
MADEILVDNGSRKMTLDELGQTQPGMGRLMPEVGVRVWKLWYAGQAENWPLARFQLKEAVNLMELGAFVRPKYEDNMGKFLEENLAPVKKAIEDGDKTAFTAAFHAMVDAANSYHELYDKPFLRWRIPDMPPPDLDMTPRG